VLQPLPYHLAIRDYLKAQEPDVWNWYASHQVRADAAEAVRFELLKSTYRIDRQSWPEWYAAAEQVAGNLGLDVPITIYQSHHPSGVNASLASLPREAHVVFHGPLATKLSDAEFRAVLGHELSHLLLWRNWDGEFLIAEQVLAALSNDAQAQPAHAASARFFGLYTEIFCDRGALSVVGDAATVISMLVKVHTGMEQVNPASYLFQAEEIFRRGPTKSEGLTHPEAYLRAWAIKLWADEDPEADARIAQLIEGLPALDDLDLLGRRAVSGLTQRLVSALLGPKWFHTASVLAHARLYFEDFQPPARSFEDITLADDLQTDDAALRDYYCFVLLDFVTADRDLQPHSLAAALQLAERLGWKERFAELALDELRLRKKQLEKIDQDKTKLLAEAAKEAEE
jgi:Zn-dependent protease with chaperone function